MQPWAFPRAEQRRPLQQALEHPRGLWDRILANPPNTEYSIVESTLKATREEQMRPPLPGEQELNFIKRHRWSGLWNGVVIGMGVGWLVLGGFIGIFPLILGIGLEWVQRKRLSREQ